MPTMADLDLIFVNLPRARPADHAPLVLWRGCDRLGLPGFHVLPEFAKACCPKLRSEDRDQPLPTHRNCRCIVPERHD
jgi:hypothetical protein